MGRVSMKVADEIFYQYDKFHLNQLLFYRMRTKKECELICTDQSYNYFSILFNGHDLMFAKNKYRSDGQRLYILNDALAKCLGFINYNDMRARTPKLQHSRKMLSVNAIQRAFI